MADIVERVLQEISEKDAQYKTTEVEKNLELDFDEGNLLAVDNNPIDLKKFRSDREQFLKDLARDNAQLLINKIWQFPVEKVDETVVVELPDPKTVLPREKPIPKVKTLTKWEQYAKTKNIHKTKKGRMMWDEETKDWRPRWGYKKAGDEKRDWVLEVPDNANPNEDQFEKRNKEKRERVSKNELQRLRNIARNMKGKVPGIGLTPTETPDKDHLSRAMHQAHKSTASIGRFNNKLPKEKPDKNQGKKRKFEPVIGDLALEKKRSMDVLNKLQTGQPTLNITQATNQSMVAEERRSKPGKKLKGGKGKNEGKNFGKGKGKKQGGGKSGKMSGKMGGGGKKQGGKKRK